ncbi:HAD-IC family P-type ATPase [Sinomonas sp. P47F7]|uniref:HAD-IC family P-type ATPase n=1 Tax=Sinomonas sp. P47F7 TaxID=3410987 RepID=UPI003BF52BB4
MEPRDPRPGSALGLTSAEATERSQEGPTNRRAAATSRSFWAILRSNALTYFNAIVLAGFALLLVLGRWQDALFGLTALANIVIGAGQELRAKRTLDRLSIVSAPTARVLRDGQEHELTPDQVVLDDVLVLRAGDQAAADALILSAQHLDVDESLLTGEAEPVVRVEGETVLSGSAIVGGSGFGRVTAVGERAYAGVVVAESRRFSLVRSELHESVDRLLRWIGWAVLPLGVLVLNAQVQVQGGWAAALGDGRWREAAVDTVAAVIAMIPLGLVLMTSVAFAVGAVALARQHVLVQELPAVEGLARVDVVCLDKTGTLTDGKIVLDRVFPVGGREPIPEPAWAAALGWFGADQSGGPTARGLGESFPALDGVHSTASIGFSSARKWSAATLTGSARGTWVLGAPDVIAELTQFDLGSSSAGAAHDGAAAMSRAEEHAASGLRTILLAHSPSPLSEEDSDAQRVPDGLRPAVVLTFRETLRPDAAQTLAYFRAQGVEVRVVSGDHPETVAAVARAAGLDAGPGFDARELPEDPDAFAREVVGHRVLGRVTPDQKRRLVHALQAAGHTVAMTGDGVNDALAVKDADLGIAMASGSAATKAVSRIVLLDNSFAHFPDVVAQGRKVMANIELVAVLFLTKTAYAMLLSALLGVLLVETPFLPRQLSVTDGLTIGIPAFFLALLHNERPYAPGFLRRAVGFALPNGAVVAVCLFAVATVGDDAGLEAAQVRTVATLCLTAVGVWVLSCQARPLSGLRRVVVAAMPASALVFYLIPSAAGFLDFAAPPVWFGALGSGIALAGCAGIEAVHRFRLRGRAGSRFTVGGGGGRSRPNRRRA